MVIVTLFDAINGYRYRKISLEYYYRIAGFEMVVGAWIIPGTVL